MVFESLAQPRRGGDKQRGGEKRRDGEKGRDGEVEREALKSILRLSREKEIQRKVLEQEEERNKIYDWNWMENFGVYLWYVGEKKGVPPVAAVVVDFTG